MSNAERASQPSGDVEIPPEPTAEDRALRDEQKVFRTEALMLQGITHPRELMPTLGVQDRRQMERYIKRAETIWEYRGRQTGIEKERGKAIREYDKLTAELWTLWEASCSVREKGAIIETLIRLRDKKNILHGLTPEQIEAISKRSDVPDNVLRSMAKQDELVEMVRMYAQLIREETDNPTQGLNRIVDPNTGMLNDYAYSNDKDDDDEYGGDDFSGVVMVHAHQKVRPNT